MVISPNTKNISNITLNKNLFNINDTVIINFSLKNKLTDEFQIIDESDIGISIYENSHLNFEIININTNENIPRNGSIHGLENLKH